MALDALCGVVAVVPVTNDDEWPDRRHGILMQADQAPELPLDVG